MMISFKKGKTSVECFNSNYYQFPFFRHFNFFFFFGNRLQKPLINKNYYSHIL